MRQLGIFEDTKRASELCRLSSALTDNYKYNMKVVLCLSDGDRFVICKHVVKRCFVPGCAHDVKLINKMEMIESLKNSYDT